MDAEHDPYRQANQQEDHQTCEHERNHVIALSLRAVQVQEVHQVNQDLDHRERQDDHQGDRLRQGWVHHQAERDQRQDDRQDEANGVRLDAAVAVIMAVMGMCISHYRVPIR